MKKVSTIIVHIILCLLFQSQLLYSQSAIEKNNMILAIKKKLSTHWEQVVLAGNSKFEKYIIKIQVTVNSRGEIIGRIKPLEPKVPKEGYLIAFRQATNALRNAKTLPIISGKYPNGIIFEITFDPSEGFSFGNTNSKAVNQSYQDSGQTIKQTKSSAKENLEPAPLSSSKTVKTVTQSQKKSTQKKLFENKRVALLVGNAKYKNNRLANPINDIKLLEKTLRNVGFEVITATNVDRKNFRKSLDKFKNKLKSYGEETDALFYYSGHGMQYEGKNHLIPLKSDIQTEYDLDDETINTTRIFSAMSTISAGAKIILLDACRDSNFKSFVRSGTKGLAQMNAVTGTIIGYATAPGDVALDGSGSNSPFAKALAKAIMIPGLDIERVLKEARKNVSKDTMGRQIPWSSSSLIGDFYFIPE